MMDMHNDVSLPQIFFTSWKSRLGKIRRNFWLGSLFFLVLTGVLLKSWNTFVWIAGFVIALMLLIEWLVRRQMQFGKAFVTLDSQGVEAHALQGKIKRINWTDIVSVAVESIQGNSFLKFQLTNTPEHPDRRRLLGSNPAQPMLPLNGLTEESQTDLLRVLNEGLQRYSSPDDSKVREVVDTLAAEKALQDRLRLLTPIPWVTYFLVAANVLIWFYGLFQGASFIQTPADKLLLWGGNAASEVQRGDWWRLLSATFLHGGLMHLTMNMIGLVSVGILVERIYGHRLYALVYLGAGLIGSALSLHFSAQTAVSVGASGAIFGITGALLVAVYQHRDSLPSTFSKNMVSSLLVFIIYSLIQGFAKQGIDNAAHVGGLLGGAMLAFLLPERFDMEHFMTHWKKRAVLGGVLALLMTLGLEMTAPSAAIDLRRQFDGQVAFQQAIEAMVAAGKMMQQEQADIKSGKISELDADTRSRAVFAPMFRQVNQKFSEVDMPPTDKRLPLVLEYIHMTNLLVETLEMQSVYHADTGKIEPIDPLRAAQINTEIGVSGAKIQQLVQTLKTQK